MSTDRVIDTPVRRQGRRALTRGQRISAAAVGLILIVILYEIVGYFIAYTSDAYVQSDLIGVAPQVTGRIIEVSVTDNQPVAAGDPLVTIDPVPFQLTADQHRAEVNEAKAQVAADLDMITSSQAEVDAAVSAATYAHENYRRLSTLGASQDVSRADVQKAEDEQRRADAQVQATRAALDRMQSMLAMHQAAESSATAALGTAAWQLSRTKVVAPASGTVTNLTVRVGDTAQTDVPLIGLVDAHAWRITANYKQSFIRDFKPGATAWVWLDSQPWHLHRARVEGVARGISRNPVEGRLLPYVTPTTDWIRLQRRFPVTLTLVDLPSAMPLYMGADARVLILP
jgi:membrane fusion protein, multidrug efflux system